MSILSLTYHCTESFLDKWEVFFTEQFPQLIEKHINTEKYILSEVHTEMIQEGKNYNLLVFFHSQEKRQDFLDKEYSHIQSYIMQEFGQEVMDFVTLLNQRMYN